MAIGPRTLAALLILFAPAVATATTVDRYGRVLSDPHGPVHYRLDDGTWKSVHGDGAVRLIPGPPALPREESGGRPTTDYTLGPYLATSVGSWPEAVAIGDVTGDSLPDVVMTTTEYFDPANDHHVFIFPQQADGSLGSPTQYPYGAGADRNGIALVDLDGDALLDVVVGHEDGISVLLTDGIGGLLPATVTSGEAGDTLAAMDVDLDGHTDVIGLSWSDWATIYYGNGAGGFRRVEALATFASGYNDHEVEDLDGDGQSDLAVMSGQLYSTPNLSVHLHDGISTLSAAPQSYFMGVNELSDGIGLGDVTGDGLHDAVLSRFRNSPTWLWMMEQDGAGSLAGPTMLTTYDCPEPVEVADLDNDGLEDVTVLHGGWNRVGVYLQDSLGGLTPESLYTIPYASHYAMQGLAVGDFSGDGIGDVAITDYNHGLVVLYGGTGDDDDDSAMGDDDDTTAGDDDDTTAGDDDDTTAADDDDTTAGDDDDATAGDDDTGPVDDDDAEDDDTPDDSLPMEDADGCACGAAPGRGPALLGLLVGLVCWIGRRPRSDR